jgi:hypothetical protein
MSRRTLCAAGAAVATLLHAAFVPAQIPTSPLEPVDPRVGDLSPLATSFRDLSVDLRAPSGFSQVYRTPDGEARFTRGSGALFATFPFSAYRNTKEGTKVLIPAGTVFHIGAPWETPIGEAAPNANESETSADTGRWSMRLGARMVANLEMPETAGAIRENDDARFRQWTVATRPPPMQPATRDATAPAEDISPAPTSEEPGRTLVNDEVYRAQRLADLLRRAAQVEGRRAAQQGGEGDVASQDKSPDS